MPSQYLQAVPTTGVPDSTSAVHTGRDDFGSLRVELAPGNLSVVAHQLSYTGSRVDVVDSGLAIGRGRYDFCACGVEADIQNLILGPMQRVDALPSRHVPDFTGPVNAPRRTVLTSELKLG